MCRAAESTKEHMKELAEAHENSRQTSYIKKSKQKTEKSLHQQNKKTDSKFKMKQPTMSSKLQSKCGRCGQNHMSNQKCPAMGQICRHCNGKNYFAKQCFFKQEKKVHTIEDSPESELEYSE